jgi:HlyD family secretion protein
MPNLSKKLIILAGLLGLIAFYYVKKQPKLVNVDIVRIEKGEVKATVSNTRVGTVKACRRAYLAPATGGQVAKLHVKEGDKVKQHQLLMEVWNDDLKAQVKLQEAQIRANQASSDQTCQLGGSAVREAQRMEKLQKLNHIVSEEQVDTKQTGARSKQAACRAALEAIAVSQANRDVAEAAVLRTLVFAPFDGTVAEINVELGEFVTPSPPGILTLPAIDLLDVSCLFVSAPIDEVDAPKIQNGMSACVSLDAFTNKRCSGKVTRIAPYVLEKEKQARTVEVEVTITDPEEIKDLLPGYSADIEVLLASKQLALNVPAEAVMENNRVLRVNSEGILEERAFTPGLANWNTVEILSGLNEGDQIALSIGKDDVTKGAHVRIKP